MTSDLEAGVLNLLINCAGVRSGESLLIVREDPKLGWYDTAAPKAVSDAADSMGLITTMMQVGAPGLSKDPGLLNAIAAHDITIFFARVGDQDRFEDNAGQERSVMVYARDAASLSSPFGRTNHHAMAALKEAVNEVVFSANHIEVTCSLGTRFSGTVPHVERENATEVTVKRFPVGVPQPVPAKQFSGRVVLARFLTPTGSMPYEPASCAIHKPVIAVVEDGRVVDFKGEVRSVGAVRQHYRTISSRFGIDRDCVHSWHAGMHPGCSYDGRLEDDPDRWSNNVFMHPRFLHFHTCGDYAPGEICWMILDPTIAADGNPLWDNGKLMFENFKETSAVVKSWPELHDLMSAPSTAIGVDA